MGRSGRRRLALLALAGLIGAGSVVVRLHRLQIEEGRQYLAKARANTVVVERVDAPRGRIFDCKGHLLVSNKPEFQLEVVPAEVTTSMPVVLRNVTAALGAPIKQALLNKLNKGLKKAPLEPAVVGRSLSIDAVARITPLLRHNKGLYLTVRERREYHGPNHAAHVLGFTGEINENELERLKKKGYRALDRLGKEGVERTYDMQLRGRKGVREVTVDARGRTVIEHEVRTPVPGLDLILCMDWELQTFCEQALSEQLEMVRKKNGEISGGSVVVMEPHSGRVKALVSLPQYDPRPFSRGIKNKEYAQLLRDPGLPLVDRATRSDYSPGSTFKLVTSSAALNENLCGPISTFYCGGSYAGANCFVRSGHGHIGFEDSIAVSCDVVYYMLGVRLGIDRLRHYCAAMGLGKPTGLDLPGEGGGNLPSPAWKLKAVGDKWYEGDTVNMSIGQGFLSVTPLQMAVVTSVVANGGKVVRPHLADRLVSYQGRTVTRISNRPVRRVKLKNENLAALRRGMRGAVTHGTGGACNSPFVEVAGKTGTVENSPSSENRQGRDHTWFVSFAPYEHPQYVVVVCLEKSGGFGGSMCAPVARKIYDHMFEHRLREKPAQALGKLP